MEMLTALRYARCEHCDWPVVEYQGDLTITPWWAHVHSGQRSCDDTPKATPKAGTVRPAEQEMAALDARIDALHGSGAAKAIDAAYADGSIFNDHETGQRDCVCSKPMPEPKSPALHTISDLAVLADWQAYWRAHRTFRNQGGTFRQQDCPVHRQSA